jgi:hypothetical protein
MRIIVWVFFISMMLIACRLDRAGSPAYACSSKDVASGVAYSYLRSQIGKNLRVRLESEDESSDKFGFYYSGTGSDARPGYHWLVEVYKADCKVDYFPGR